jgi:hypothetical protein
LIDYLMMMMSNEQEGEIVCLERSSVLKVLFCLRFKPDVVDDDDVGGVEHRCFDVCVRKLFWQCLEFCFWCGSRSLRQRSSLLENRLKEKSLKGKKKKKKVFLCDLEVFCNFCFRCGTESIKQPSSLLENYLKQKC